MQKVSEKIVDGPKFSLGRTERERGVPDSLSLRMGFSGLFVRKESISGRSSETRWELWSIRASPGDGRTNFAVAGGGPGSFWNDFCQIADHLRDHRERG